MTWKYPFLALANNHYLRLPYTYLVTVDYLSGSSIHTTGNCRLANDEESFPQFVSNLSTYPQFTENDFTENSFSIHTYNNIYNI